MQLQPSKSMHPTKSSDPLQQTNTDDIRIDTSNKTSQHYSNIHFPFSDNDTLDDVLSTLDKHRQLPTLDTNDCNWSIINYIVVTTSFGQLSRLQHTGINDAQ